MEQTRDADDRRAVVEEREQLDCPRERVQQRPGDLFGNGALIRVAALGVIRGMKRVRRRIYLVCEVANFREGVDEFGACSLTVCQKARGVAPVDAAPGGEQVVARAPRDAAQLKLARRGRCILARTRAGQREAGVALDALARGKQRVPLGFVNEAALREQVFDGAERINARTLNALNLLLVVGEALVRLSRTDGPLACAPEQEQQRRQRPGERRGCGLRDGARVSRVARAPVEKLSHAEGRCRGEVDDGEFAQKHCRLPEGNAHASLLTARRRCDAARAYAHGSRIFSGFC